MITIEHVAGGRIKGSLYSLRKVSPVITVLECIFIEFFESDPKHQTLNVSFI